MPPITVQNTATLSTGAANLDLLSTTTATSTSQLNLNGGTTTVGGFIKSSTGAAQVSTINFNGGTLRYGGSAANTSFLPTLTGLTANVQSGGARIDDNGQAIGIAQSLVHDPALSMADGGLTKLGAGTLTISGAITYSGNTTITAGRLQLNGLNYSLYNIAGAGALSVGNGITSSTLTADSINVGTLSISAGSKITINPISNGPLSSSNALATVPEPSIIVLLTAAGFGVLFYQKRTL